MHGFLRFILVYLILSIEGRPGETSGGPPSFSKVYLAFAEEHSLEFISGFGHCFVCLAPADSRTAADLLLAPSVNFGVDTSSAGQGLFLGHYTVQPTFELVRKNSFFQQRRLIFFELDLGESDLKRLRSSLAARLSQGYPYDFYRRNCGYYLADWLLSEDQGSSRALPRFYSYLTPRQAVGLLVKRFGIRGGKVVNSPGLLAEEKLSAMSSDESTRIKALHANLQLINECRDPEMRLLYLQMLESHASREVYQAINLERTRIISTDEGRKAAKEIMRKEAIDFKELSAVWPSDNEGPMFGVSMLMLPHIGANGIGLTWEAGIRDIHTEPTPAALLRQVHLLSISSDFYADQIKSTLTLLEINNIRDIKDLFGVGSSGAALLYNERVDSLGIKGVCAHGWGGIGARSEALGWGCARLHLLADKIGSDSRLRIVPEVFLLSTTRFPISLSVSIHPRGQFGIKAETMYELKDRAGRDVRLSFERAPESDSRLELGDFIGY